MSRTLSLLAILALLAGWYGVQPHLLADPAPANGRIRVVIETDAGGDPDDEQSLVRFLLYANEWDVEGIIANRAQTRRPENKNPEATGLFRFPSMGPGRNTELSLVQNVFDVWGVRFTAQCIGGFCNGVKMWVNGTPCLSSQRRMACEIDHFQRGADALGGAVLEADHGVHGDIGVAPVDRIDNPGIFLVDDAAADLSGAGQFAVVGVEFLVEQQEFGDALRRRQRGVDRFDLLAHQLVDFGARGEVGVGGKRDAVLLRPFGDDGILQTAETDDWCKDTLTVEDEGRPETPRPN